MTPTTMTRQPRWIQLKNKKDEKLSAAAVAELQGDAARIKLRAEILQHGTEHPEIKRYKIGMLDEVRFLSCQRNTQIVHS